MADGSPQRDGSESFTAPEAANQRRYEALRAFFVEDLTGQITTRQPGRRVRRAATR